MKMGMLQRVVTGIKQRLWNLLLICRRKGRAGEGKAEHGAWHSPKTRSRGPCFSLPLHTQTIPARGHQHQLGLVQQRDPRKPIFW